MSVVLTKQHMKNIQAFKYETNPWTWLDLKVNPWWEFVVRCLPNWVSPNLITLLGCIVPIISMVYLATIDLTTMEPMPASAIFLFLFSAFWF